MTTQENLKDITDKRILKTSMYSFDEVRKMFELERQRIKEFIKLLKNGVEFLEKDYANLDIADKKDVINLIDKLAGEVLSEEEGR